MAFVIGFMFGALVTFMITCVIASKKINEAYMEGFKQGQKEMLNRAKKWRDAE